VWGNFSFLMWTIVCLLFSPFWYLQNSESCQIVECAWLDWCNLITIQITTKYKIRTKYDDNLRLYKNRESRRHHLCNLPESTYQRTKVNRLPQSNQAYSTNGQVLLISSVSIKFILFSMLYLTKHEYVLSIFLLILNDTMWDMIMKTEFKTIRW
jgi:hypothetical protein